jgi:hypothetical protein
VKIAPVYLFDTYGVIEVFSSGSNSAIQKFSDGLKNGQVKILERVGRELEAVDPLASRKLKGLRISKKSIPIDPVHSSTQQLLMEKHGVGIFGGLPTAEHFESVAVAWVEKLILVSSGGALKSCHKIVAKCDLKTLKVISVLSFSQMP